MAFVRWSANALANLDKLDPIIRERVLLKVSWLKENLTNVVPERLYRELRGLYKLRVGDYRATYSVHQDVISIEVVGHRRDIYK